MKRIKKYLAVLLSMGMLLSAMPATAVWGSPGNSQTEDDVKTNDYRTASPGSADREEPKEEPEETKNPAPSEDTDRLEKEEESGKQEIPKIPAESKAPVRKNAAKKATETIADRRTEDQVTFNTGSGPVRVVPEETFDEGEGDAAFEDDGSYTINIP